MKTQFASLLLAFALTTSSVSFANQPTAFKTDPAGKAAFEVAFIPQSGNMKLNVAVEKTSKSALVIRFLDAKGNELASQRVGKNELKKQVRFDLTELPDGAYKVEVTDGTDTQVKDLTITTNSSRTISAG
ncbi:MAG: hypothetical protein LH606_08785 [Cytophagaceae bacterium]|nr:hypothetical protein [Cytophagaceae bacterium]